MGGEVERPAHRSDRAAFVDRSAEMFSDTDDADTQPAQTAAEAPLDAHHESMRPTPTVVPQDVSEAEARQAIVDQATAELAVVKKRQRCDQKALLGLAHQAMRAGQILSPDDPRSLNTLSQFFERIHGMEREWFGVTSAMQPEP